MFVGAHESFIITFKTGWLLIVEINTGFRGLPQDQKEKIAWAGTANVLSITETFSFIF